MKITPIKNDSPGLYPASLKEKSYIPAIQKQNNEARNNG